MAGGIKMNPFTGGPSNAAFAVALKREQDAVDRAAVEIVRLQDRIRELEEEVERLKHE
jgi:predicted Zn-dependent protease